MSKKVLTIVGPTAVGKSSCGISLAKDFNGEIINGDSIQVYKELNIGSAKTTKEEMDGIVHHLIDYKTIGEDYNVQVFQKDAREKIDEISNRNHLPIVVGGTGLYIKALLYDYSFTEMERVEEDYEGIDNETLYQRLTSLDPSSASKIHPNNRRRIVRALQMAESGHLKSEQEEKQKHEMIYDSYLVGLTMDREQLKERINQRVDLMFEQGLVEEVSKIQEKYEWEDHGLQGIGYKEFKGYFANEISLEETKELIKTHTRQFAKRQYTWWNNQMQVNWYDVNELDYMDNIIKDVENWLNGK